MPAPDPIRQGTLSSGRRWCLVESRRRSPREDGTGPITGRHLILALEDESAQPTITERSELWLLAEQFAREFAVRPGRYRIGQNGDDLCTRETFHIHIILPNVDEELPKLVFRG
ncbi:MAG: hypothetical protein A2744_01705 [Candidatus Buchananbacteria bacterium RIFCSPHIGHO2_01_FULL_44_11]|uniref:HIT domain-containing protein n=1 Tax=Candidatus Buchananbacteria bacterium RIFCSPHIGHO2_01_FULL_44_11 TaxID=1797535 RepID=A0A1G1Y2A5_9BACT|nr:MAG: hypothetical protein A2744_01705 [Candidatus Buchananbacteria bacterium RIFCSPHIGHO2_01_FULL_44_11]